MNHYQQYKYDAAERQEKARRQRIAEQAKRENKTSRPRQY
jgi:hypothetical protein